LFIDKSARICPAFACGLVLFAMISSFVVLLTRKYAALVRTDVDELRYVDEPWLMG